MSAYSIHVDKCSTCKGFDNPGTLKYSIMSRCAVGQGLYVGPGTKSSPAPMTTRREPEVFNTSVLDPDD